MSEWRKGKPTEPGWYHVYCMGKVLMADVGQDKSERLTVWYVEQGDQAVESVHSSMLTHHMPIEKPEAPK